jgi:hypothetical protein
MNKVFVLGLQKTGTTSMGDALTFLGYRTTGPNFIFRTDLSSSLNMRMEEVLHNYDAFQDNPWCMTYKEVFQLYPQSKFILTVREPCSWLDSLKRHYRHREFEPMMYHVFGKDLIEPWNDEKLLEFYSRHILNVKKYFDRSPDSLLTIDLSKDDCWVDICQFLRCAVPAIDFPHSNSSSKPSGALGSMRSRIRRRLKIIFRNSQFY